MQTAVVVGLMGGYCMQLETFRKTLMKSLREHEDNSLRYFYSIIILSLNVNKEGLIRNQSLTYIF